jgi:hypothetical protein
MVRQTQDEAETGDPWELLPAWFTERFMGDVWETHRELWNAILDLEVEAKHYTPARPPHGRRPA